MSYIRVVKRSNGVVKIFNIPAIYKIEIGKLLNSWNAKCVITNNCVMTDVDGWNQIKEYLI